LHGFGRVAGGLEVFGDLEAVGQSAGADEDVVAVFFGKPGGGCEANTLVGTANEDDGFVNDRHFGVGFWLGIRGLRVIEG